MATLTIDADDLVLHLSAPEKLGAFRGDLRRPMSSVRDVSVTLDPYGEVRGLRAPGTGLPGRILLGTWRYRGGYDILAVSGRRPAVIVTLDGTRPRRVILSSDDADAIAARLRVGLPHG